MGRTIKRNFKYAEELANLIINTSGIDIFENSRKREVIEHRSLLIYILREVERMSLFSIRDFFKQNGKQYDHSTVHHSYKNFEMYSTYNPKLLEYYNLLVKDSNSPSSRKFLAKTIIDNSEPALADLFIYMYQKSSNELQQ
jgi:ABC-type lipoprotein release transport system permease subunit